MIFALHIHSRQISLARTHYMRLLTVSSCELSSEQAFAMLVNCNEYTASLRPAATVTVSTSFMDA